MRYLLFITTITIFQACKKYESNEGAFKDNFKFVIADTAGVKADGATSITLRLSNTKEVKEGLTASFESTKGTVLQKDLPYRNMLAETKLLLSEDTNTFSIKATLKDGSTILFEKYITASFPLLYQASLFTASVQDSTGVRANGASRITIRFAGPLIKPGLIVHLETNKGSLLQPDITFQNGAAQTNLTVAQDTGIYVIKGQLKDGTAVKVEKTILFSFLPARADFISLESGASTWNAPTPIVIKTLLTRTDGKVSTGQTVFFKSYQVISPGDTINAGRLEGLFNNVSSANGTLADVKIIPDTPGMDITKPLGLVAKTINDRGDTVRVYLTLPHQ